MSRRLNDDKRMTRYVVGIDLGTTNTVVAYAEAGSNEIRLFEIEQLVAPGEVKAGALLPSLRYHPAPGELAPHALQLPWAQAPEQQQVVIGRLARHLGAQVPGRLVASAKSWLSHAAVDRLAPILPWGAPPEVPKVSPMDASASYLAHVRAAWNARFPQHPLEQQDIVLTVPASFDEGARALTVQAATQAGLPQLRLLEEPQAAFYDWLFRYRHMLHTELAATRLILVCDVGGGTTDFSLIKVALDNGQPQLTRIGVGKHLMLGGDNMDLALAQLVEMRMTASEADAAEAPRSRLSAARLSQMLERCRAAKEQLLAANAPEQTTVTLLGAGSQLIGGARSVALARAEVAHTIVDGFFPVVAPSEPLQQRRSGIVEFGLPYVSDPAVTRHLAAFLKQHAVAAREALGDDRASEHAVPIPDTLLLNGGVFRAPVLAQRLQDTLAAWRGAPLRLLHNDNPDVAVARGAVAYALAHQGLAPKIGGGAARSYFLVLDPAKQAVSASQAGTEPAPAPVHRAICILPRGSEPGQAIPLQERSFALRVGQPVRFHLVSSLADAADQVPARAGDIVDILQGDFAPLPPIATVLRPTTASGLQEIPVHLVTSLTEVGTLEMHCVSTAEVPQRWRLEFQLRGDAAPQPAGAVDVPSAASRQEASLPPRFHEAVARIERIFGARTQQVPPKEVKQLRAQLEKLLGSRERWDVPLLRALFDALWQRARARRRSADHERLWLNLAGYCLRPGFGYPLDAWRVEQVWSIFGSGVQYGKDSQVCSEWWTLWRRVAGGLDQDAQRRLLDDFAFNVQEDEAELRLRPNTLVKASFDDMLRLVASLERIPADYKLEIGAWLLHIQQGEPTPKPVTRLRIAPTADSPLLWTLGRLGARQPFYGSAHDVVPMQAACAWLDRMLALDWKRAEAAAFAAAHLARKTGDRARDVPDALRERVMSRLEALHAPAIWSAMVREVVQMDEASERLVLGEALPPGLKLLP